MAGNGKIKGITIEFAADSSALTKALKEADSAAKQAQTSLREIDKALKFDPGNVDLLKQKQTELKKIIESTKTELDGFKAELAAMDAAGVDKTDESYMKLERTILQTENQLKNFNSELSKVEAQLTPLGQLGAKFEEVGGKCTALGQKLTGVSTAAAGVVASIGAITVSAGVWADDLNTLSKVTGIGTDKLQMYAAAADLVDVSVSTIAKSVTKMKKSMLSASEGTGATAEAFKKLGVEVTNADGSLRDQDAVFQEVIAALGEMSNETERDALAMQIFGKSATELNPLIEDCGETYKNVAEMFAENGIEVVDQETLDKANEFNDSIDKMKANIQQAKNVLGAKLGEAFGDDIERLSSAVGNLAGKLSNMNPNVLKVITIIAGIVAVLAPLLIIIGAVITAIGTISGALAGLPVLIETITGGISAAAGAVTAFLGPVGIAIAVVAAVAAGLIYAYNHFDKFRQFVDKAKDKIVEFGAKVGEFASSVKEKISGMVNDVIEKFTNLKTKVVNKANDIFDGIKGAFSNIASIGRNIVEGLWNGIKDKTAWIIEKIKSFTNNVKDSLKKFFGINSPSKWARDMLGKNLALGIGVGFDSAMAGVTKDMRSTLNGAEGMLASRGYSVGTEVSNAIGTGLALANSGPNQFGGTIVVNLGGAKVAEQVFKLNKQGALALQG